MLNLVLTSQMALGLGHALLGTSGDLDGLGLARVRGELKFRAWGYLPAVESFVWFGWAASGGEGGKHSAVVVVLHTSKVCNGGDLR